MCAKDKKGRHPHPHHLLDGFKKDVEDCQLSEIELSGSKFTWEKSKGSENWVREWLDRAFATNTWWNHEPIKLNIFNTSITKKQFCFKFENTWLREENFHLEVTSFWQNLPPTHLLPKLISVSSFMARWEKSFFHKFREKVIKQKEILDALKSREDRDGIQLYFFRKAKLKELLVQEESY